uniref:EF-hand domain-containing protein n=1 Tax=Tetradesmus obliquus TaxID=3088 RepID=A0A383VTQ4_TETOB|eukprot:jgi/Sobl393_1/16394/SZX67776.1
MDVHSGSDQPAKAQASDKEATKKNEGLAAAVASSISQTWQRKQQRQPEDDLEGGYTATPLPALPSALRGAPRQRSRWQQLPQQQQTKQQQQQQPQLQQGKDLQLLPFLQAWSHRACQVTYTASIRPFSDPCYCGPIFLQAVLALLLSVALVPLGVALQLQGTLGLIGLSRAASPWSGVLYIAAAVPLLRLLAAPVAAGLFWLGEVLFLGWPLFSKTPNFRSCRQLHRFAWLVTSVALLVWHAVVFQVLLQQPASQWSGPLDLGTCSSQASLQVQHACTHTLVSSYSLRLLCCLLAACVASCACALLGCWLLLKALAAHGLAGRGCSTAPLLLQEASLAVLCPQAAVGGEAAAQQLLEPFLHQNQPVQQLAQQQGQQQQQQLAPGAQRVLLPRRQLTPPEVAQEQVQKRQQQQQQQQYQHSVAYDVGACCTAAKAAAGATALTAAASVSVLVLAVLVLAATAAAQPAVAVAAAVAVPAAAAATIAAAAALAAMAAQRQAAASVTAFGAACCACPAAAIACAAAIIAAQLQRDAASKHVLTSAFYGTAIGALLAALLAALLQLLAAEPHEAWSKQRSQRSKQVAAWQLLSSIMQRYLHTHSSSGSSSSSWGTSYSQAWQQEAAAAWRQLELQVAPSKDASTVSGISPEDIMSMFNSLGSSEAAAAAAAQAFSWLDADRDGKISQEDMQAAFAARGRSHLGLALTLSRKAELALEVQSLVHVLLQAVLVVLYLAVFELGTQLWSGIIAALVLLLLGCIWMFGDASRHSLSSAHWLLTANPFSIGDTITYSSSSWLVIDFNAAATTLQCLATNIPHTVPNPSLRSSTSIANSSRCSAPTIAVRASIVGMPAAKLEQFLEHVQAAAAAAAAAQPALFVAGSCGVRLVGDRLVCNGSVDFVEAELALEWVSGCTASDSRSIAQAKSAMLQVVRQQYSCFMAPVDNTRPIPDVNMWSNPVYS